ncbi:MAG: hypothetical protein WD646_03985 [Actinomycetota bacterium]
MRFTPRSRTRRRGAAALVTAVMLLGGAFAQSAVAGVPWTEAPPELIQCNTEDYPNRPVGSILVCMEIQLYDGEAKFGDVESDVNGPIVIRQVFAVTQLFPEIVLEPLPDEGADGGVSLPTVKVPGGLLAGTGLEVLEPITDPVTGVSATLLTAGELTNTAPDFFYDITTSDGSINVGHVITTANLPLQVKINNLLLGDTCTIGSPEDPIDLNLDLIIIEDGVGIIPPDDLSGLDHFMPVELVDDEFSIPAAKDCGLLGTGALLNDSGLGQLNVFDQLVNGSVGLPSAPGNNHLSLTGFFGLVFRF